MLLRRALFPRYRCWQPTIYNNCSSSQLIIRNHMNHGGGDPSLHGPPPTGGPRLPNVDLGFAAAKHTGNILRLLESSHGSFFYNTVDSLSTVWHSKSQSWKQQPSDKEWKSVNPIQALIDQSSNPKTSQQSSYSSSSSIPPRLCSINFSDDRTCLIKILGQDGHIRYIQLLRLDGDAGAVASGGMTRLPNDGWVILQEVVVEQQQQTESNTSLDDQYHKLESTIMAYLDIEHGGGDESYESAMTLFHPESKLMSVGIDDIDASPTQWTGPVGSYVEIPLKYYLDGVQQQSPHDQSVKLHDSIVSIDYTTGANAAAATVRVGNGAKTLVFEDHLLLGRNESAGDNDDNMGWCILAKTFSSQKWKS